VDFRGTHLILELWRYADFPLLIAVSLHQINFGVADHPPSTSFALLRTVQPENGGAEYWPIELHSHP
jgi:hypothetical protein